MNQHLQSILDIIQQDEKVTAEQKNVVSKSIKKADKEFETITFKLDKTEKIKKTTAILLEETIAELEQKRKAVEAQNRELEIESSLERVRTVAMSMNKPDDLLSICEVLFKELRALGFTELRNALIYTFVDEKNYFNDYDYSDFTGGNISHIPYSGHPVIERFIKEIRKANDAFVEIEITGKELEEWKEFRKVNGEADDPRLDNIQALYYYNYSVGAGGIGISTYSSISAEKQDLLKRFRNVFDLAYRRYTDIQKAEAQVREARIELGLERVRARAMAMQKSDDLAEAVGIIFEELDKLDIGILRCGIGIINKENRSVNVWTTSISDENTTVQISGDESMDSHPLLQGAFNAWLKQEDYSYILQGKDLTDYYKSQLAANFKLPESQSLVKGHEDICQYYFLSTFQAGGLFAFRNTPFPEEAKK